MTFSVFIPARYASTRLPGKMLLPIAGKPMIQHVYERAVESGALRVVIATDDERIHTVCSAFGATVSMTSTAHQSGSDRLAEAAEQLGLADDEIVVNLQGDEPLMPPRVIAQVARNLAQQTSAPMATLCVPIHAAHELFNPNVVKVVMDRRGHALYFSRAPIPWHRDAFAQSKDHIPRGELYYRHLGLYAHRCGFLRQFVQWPRAEIEAVEALEQLRVLWHGHSIRVAIAAEIPPPGVDTQEDLDVARRHFTAR